jgi:hypothetical protein
MSSGFNTDVQIGNQLFHVQTEDRGPAHPIIDTAVYQNGRVLHRRSSNYQHFVTSDEFNAEGLRERVEEQHRSVIDDLRSGALDAALAVAVEQGSRAAGIQVQLLNPSSWLTGGHAFLDVEVVGRGDRKPQSGALVDARIEGAIEDVGHSGTSDDQGHVQLQFPIPPLGKGDLALVIRAKAAAGKDELRFTMRTRGKSSAGGSSGASPDSTN